MIILIILCQPLIIYFLYYIYYNNFVKSKNISTSFKETELDKYYNKNKNKLLSTFELESDFNSNIDKIVYNQKELKEKLKEEKNEIESIWKKRILYQAIQREDGQIVNLIMYYDLFKQGFGYYSNDSVVSYKILNAMAMKYVIVFFCRDFFMDEFVLNEKEIKLPILNDIFNKDEEEEEKKKKNTLNTADKDVFVKYKNNKITKNKEEKDEDDKEKNWIKNKFIHYGNIKNVSFLQKESKPKINFSHKFQGMFDSNKVFSYKDFKNLQI